MQVIPIEEVMPGMRLAKPVCGEEDGRVLLEANVELKQSYIERIRALKYGHLFIKDPGESEEDVLGPVREDTKIKATALLKSSVIQLRKNESVDISKLKSVVNEMIDQILVDPGVVYDISALRSCDNCTFSHSVNVCVISLLVGSAMGLNRNELEILGVGAIFHDIGKTLVDPKIITKPGILTHEEYKNIKQHPRMGYELLKKRVNISFISAHLALQHHEREDGTGYPRNLTGKWIHRFAKIVAVADVFDAMTALRSYRKAVPPHLAVEEITAKAKIKFDQTAVHYFTKVITPYPINSILSLNNGQKVVVTYVSHLNFFVKVISGPYQGLVYDLHEHPKLKVEKFLG